jgi:hypothetical protein
LANSLYDKGRQKFLEGGIAWLTDTIKAVLVDAADYTVNLATHEFLSDIPSGARVATSNALASKTSTAGVAGSGTITFPTATGDISEAIVFYKDTGSAATSPLIAYIDTATGLPIAPNGNDITVTPDPGTVKLFRL